MTTGALFVECARVMELAAEATGCARWAYVEADLDGVRLVLYPRDRGEPRCGAGYTVDEDVVNRGVARIMLRLKGDMPPGVPVETRTAIFVNRYGDGGGVGPLEADHIVQVGLFGEVFYL